MIYYYTHGSGHQREGLFHQIMYIVHFYSDMYCIEIPLSGYNTPRIGSSNPSSNIVISQLSILTQKRSPNNTTVPQ